jgi:hypothetical protein
MGLGKVRLIKGRSKKLALLVFWASTGQIRFKANILPTSKLEPVSSDEEIEHEFGSDLPAYKLRVLRKGDDLQQTVVLLYLTTA